jgi:cytochrome oxidase Cu insertion factor (SCO1/SenC/PrrC family)
MAKRLSFSVITNAILLSMALVIGGTALWSFFHRAPEGAMAAVPKLQGKLLKPFTALTLDSTPIQIPTADGVPTLLYFFSTDCNACKSNEGAWQALTDSLQGQVHAVAVSREPMAILATYYREARAFDPAVFGDPSSQASIDEEFRFWGTPTTYLFDGSGRLLTTRVGVYDSDDVIELITVARRIPKSG